MSLWHGTADATVRPANLQEEVEQWTDVNAIDAKTVAAWAWAQEQLERGV